MGVSVGVRYLDQTSQKVINDNTQGTKVFERTRHIERERVQNCDLCESPHIHIGTHAHCVIIMLHSQILCSLISGYICSVYQLLVVEKTSFVATIIPT